MLEVELHKKGRKCGQCNYQAMDVKLVRYSKILKNQLLMRSPMTAPLGDRNSHSDNFSLS